MSLFRNRHIFTAELRAVIARFTPNLHSAERTNDFTTGRSLYEASQLIKPQRKGSMAAFLNQKCQGTALNK